VKGNRCPSSAHPGGEIEDADPAEWNAATDIAEVRGAYTCKLRRVRECFASVAMARTASARSSSRGTPTEVALFNAVEEGTCTETEAGYPQSDRTCKTRVEIVFRSAVGIALFQILREGNKR